MYDVWSCSHHDIHKLTNVALVEPDGFGVGLMVVRGRGELVSQQWLVVLLEHSKDLGGLCDDLLDILLLVQTESSSVVILWLLLPLSTDA